MLSRKLILTLLLCGLFALGFNSCSEDSSDSNVEALIPEIPFQSFKSELIPDTYIIVFKEDAFRADDDINGSNYNAVKEIFRKEIQKILNENDIYNKVLSHVYVKVYKGASMTLNAAELAKLRSDKRISLIEQDQTMHISGGGPPGSGNPPAQSTPWGITRIGGSQNGASAGRAWVIDSGIDLDHTDLNVDVANSATFLGGNSTPDDQNGHGTHVAGTIGAINNSIGVIGAAAGALVVSVRVLDRRGSGSNSGVIAGVDYVAANAASGDAANMSLGGGVSTALDNAVLSASSSCPFALAAGNDSAHASNSSPARVNGPNIYTVASMTSSNGWSSFSNYGQPPVDYIAPGSSVLSCYKDNGYATLSGTSMAAPHMCGILLIGGVTNGGSVTRVSGDVYTVANH